MIEWIIVFDLMVGDVNEHVLAIHPVYHQQKMCEEDAKDMNEKYHKLGSKIEYFCEPLIVVP